MSNSHSEFIPEAGACLATANVLEGRGRVRWMVRGASKAPADNGWQIMSHIDDSAYLNDTSNWRIVETPTGREIPTENLYVPPQHRA